MMRLLPALLAFLLIGCIAPPSRTETAASDKDAAANPGRHGPLSAADVSLVNDQRRTSPARVVSFGQVFAPKTVHAGDRVDVIVGDRVLPSQIDAKALAPDGSVRHAVVSVELPAMDAGERINARFVSRSEPPTPAASPATYTPAPAVNVRLRLKEGKSTSTVDVDLASVIAKQSGGKPDYWLNGPLARERRYAFDVTPKLQILFDVFTPRTGPARVDVIFHNDWHDLKPDDTVTYDVAISVAGKSVFTADNVEQYPYSTWHRVVWSDGSAGIRNVPNITQLASAGATPRYDPKFAIGSSIRSELASAAGDKWGEPMGSGMVMKYMPTTGGRMEIGPLPTWTVADLLHSDADSRRVLLGNADAAGSVPWHIRERSTNGPLTIDKYPELWLDSRGQNNAPLPQVFVESNFGWTLDDAHQSSLTYVPYLLTGLRSYKDELAQQAAYVLLYYSPEYRGGSAGLIIGSQGQAWQQVRGLAWSLRTLAAAAYILPADDPMQPYFDAKLRGNLAKLAELYVDQRTQRSSGALEGWVPGAYRPPNSVAPWQQAYLAVILGWINNMGYADADRTLAWMSKFLSGLFTNKANGFDPYYGPAYALAVSSPDGETPITTWSQAFKSSDLAGLSTQEASSVWDYYGMAMRAALGSAAVVTDSERVDAALCYVSGRLGPDARSGDPTFAISPEECRPR